MQLVFIKKKSTIEARVASKERVMLQREATPGPVRLKGNPWGLRLRVVLSRFPSREADIVHKTQTPYKNQNKGLG